MGVQHVLAMFGSTVIGKPSKSGALINGKLNYLFYDLRPCVAPMMMGLDTNSK